MINTAEIKVLEHALTIPLIDPSVYGKSGEPQKPSAEWKELAANWDVDLSSPSNEIVVVAASPAPGGTFDPKDFGGPGNAIIAYIITMKAKQAIALAQNYLIAAFPVFGIKESGEFDCVSASAMVLVAQAAGKGMGGEAADFHEYGSRELWYVLNAQGSACPVEAGPCVSPPVLLNRVREATGRDAKALPFLNVPDPGALIDAGVAVKKMVAAPVPSGCGMEEVKPVKASFATGILGGLVVGAAIVGGAWLLMEMGGKPT